MNGRSVERIESAVDVGAAALLAGAVAYAGHALLITPVGVAASAAGAFGLCFAGLRQLSLPRRAAIASMTPVTALLAEADRLLDEQPRESDELILDDILVALDPDSRVVRLFDPGGNRTPGQLNARIDRHLEASAPAAFPDDSQALYEALTELRRSLN